MTKPDIDSNLMRTLRKTGSPTEALLAAHTHAPTEAIRGFIDEASLEVLCIEMPKLQDAVINGPTIDRENLGTIVENYGHAFAEVEKEAPEIAAKMTATVRSAGDDIAAAIDKAVSRVLLDAKVANRLAYLDLTTCHAKILKALQCLEITPEQQAEIDELASSA